MYHCSFIGHLLQWNTAYTLMNHKRNLSPYSNSTKELQKIIIVSWKNSLHANLFTKHLTLPSSIISTAAPFNSKNATFRSFYTNKKNTKDKFRELHTTKRERRSILFSIDKTLLLQGYCSTFYVCLISIYLQFSTKRIIVIIVFYWPNFI